MELVEFLLWIPALLLLGYTFPACYYDLKHREMPVGFWTVMVSVGTLITAWLYLVGYYPWYLLALSLGATGIYFMLMRMNVYQGADFVYLMFISLFLVQNPVTGHILMPVSFGIFLIASVVGFGMFYQTKIVKDMVAAQKLPGFPMMLPISLALWMTVVFA